MTNRSKPTLGCGTRIFDFSVTQWEFDLQSTPGHSGQLAVRAYDDYLGHSLTVVVYNASLFHDDYSFPIPTPTPEPFILSHFSHQFDKPWPLQHDMNPTMWIQLLWGGHFTSPLVARLRQIDCTSPPQARPRARSPTNNGIVSKPQ